MPPPRHVAGAVGTVVLSELGLEHCGPVGVIPASVETRIGLSPGVGAVAVPIAVAAVVDE